MDKPFVQFYETILSNGISSRVLSYIQKKWEKYIQPRPYQRMLGMDIGQRVCIILPSRNNLELYNKKALYLHSNVHVTFHDMLAANFAERVLSISNFSEDKIDIKTVQDLEKNRDLINEQLILICAPKANKYSADVIESISKQNPDIELNFSKEDKDEEEWIIKFKGVIYQSPSYAEEKSLHARGISPAYGPLNDYAVLARVDNPSNPAKKTILVAGIRGIGTWGASRFLKENGPNLARKFKGKNFIGIVKVTYSNYRIVKTELINGVICTSSDQTAQLPN